MTLIGVTTLFIALSACSEDTSFDCLGTGDISDCPDLVPEEDAQLDSIAVETDSVVIETYEPNNTIN